METGPRNFSGRVELEEGRAGGGSGGGVGEMLGMVCGKNKNVL